MFMVVGQNIYMRIIIIDGHTQIDNNIRKIQAP